MTDEIFIPADLLEHFLSTDDNDAKRDAQRRGKILAQTVLQTLLHHVSAPIVGAKVGTWPKRLTRAGKHQTAGAYASAGGVTAQVSFNVEDDSQLDTYLYLTARFEPTLRSADSWVNRNSAAVDALVKKYESGKPYYLERPERKGAPVPANNARFLEFSHWRTAAKRGDALIVDRAEVKAFAAEFDAMMDGIIRESLSARRRDVRLLQALVPPPVDRSLDEVGGDRILEKADVVRATLAAMASRPLVLLAGVSGTGKTQLAKRLGKSRALRLLYAEETSGPLVDRQMEALRDAGVVETAKGDADWVWVSDPSLPERELTALNFDDQHGSDADDEAENDESSDEDPADDADDEDQDDGSEVVHPGESHADQRFALVPVQADWKEASNLWGWHNVIDSGSFHGTPALRVFLDAWRTVAKGARAPHVLVLDEMNLSRLEHYGSDLLSAMENPDDEMIALHRSGTPLQLAGAPEVQVPPTMGWRDGVIVIGTVNVDETTFSFAPKVLDRAVVLEFLDVNLKLYFEETGLAAEWEKLGPWFEAVHDVLRPYNLHLGYRPAREVVSVLRAELGTDASAWADGPLKAQLDRQLRNKVLPKVRGPRGTAEPVLLGLLALAIAGPELRASLEKELVARAENGWPPTDAAAVRARCLPGSAAEKAWYMLQRLGDVGFTGFF